MAGIHRFGAQGARRRTRAFLLERLIDFTRRSGAYLPFKPNTAYVNTISPGQEQEYPGDRTIERRIEAYHPLECHGDGGPANRESSEYGGHIASYASSATCRSGLQSFLARAYREDPGDLIYFQGHASPGIYARASSKAA